MHKKESVDPMSGIGAAQHTHNALNYNRFDDPFTEVSSRLQGAIRRGNGGLLAFCPAHDDRSRSLAVSIGRHGGVLLHCFAGCGIDDITGAIGLSPADLFVKNEPCYDLKHRRQGFQPWQVMTALKHDLTRLLFVANSLQKNSALPADDRQFISELILRINSALSFVEGVK